MYLNLGRVDLKAGNEMKLKEETGLFLQFVEFDRAAGRGVLRARIVNISNGEVESEPLPIKEEATGNIMNKLPISQKEILDFTGDGNPLTKEKTSEAIEELLKDRELPWEFVLKRNENGPVIKVKDKKDGCPTCEVVLEEEMFDLFFCK